MKFENLVKTGFLDFSVNMRDVLMNNWEVLKEQVAFPIEY